MLNAHKPQLSLLVEQELSSSEWRHLPTAQLTSDTQRKAHLPGASAIARKHAEMESRSPRKEWHHSKSQKQKQDRCEILLEARNAFNAEIWAGDPWQSRCHTESHMSHDSHDCEDQKKRQKKWQEIAFSLPVKKWRQKRAIDPTLEIEKPINVTNDGKINSYASQNKSQSLLNNLSSP